MILFNNENPLTDLANLLNERDTSGANRFTGDNITVDKIRSVTASDNDGFNTIAYVRTHGDENGVVGIIEVRYNRIDLANYFPAYGPRLQLPSEKDTIYPAKLGGRFSKGLGTAMKQDGRYADYSRANFTLKKGVTTKLTVTVPSESLRYVPKNIYVQAYGLGKQLDASILDPSSTPFTDDAGGIEYTAQYKEWFDNNPHLPDSGKRSLPCTMMQLDFTSVWGENPTTIIEETNDEELPKYQFEETAFDKINAILAVQGLPPLPNRYFEAYSLQYFNFWFYRTSIKTTYSKKWANRILPNTVDPAFLNYALAIKWTALDYDYVSLANLHIPFNDYDFYVSSKYGTGTKGSWQSYMFLPYSVH